MNAAASLKALVADNRAGRARGIPSWCTAHPQTLAAILAAYCDDDDPILIEATCNQVNHRGGYTGMTPAAFRAFVEGLAGQAGVRPERIIFGGDHLGPNPWRDGGAADAMVEARAMVASFAEAGFAKIHLDASMACADDSTLPEEEIARRAAELCAVAERHASVPLAYVVGTEVPIPGGELQALDALAVTPPEAALRTHALHRSAFAKAGVADAIEKVIAIVVQPGVDMGNEQVFGFDKAKAAHLSAAIGRIPGAVFEAHSTDYQSERALTDLVASHFAILKVGPSLTFAFRETVFALASIEEAMGLSPRSGVKRALEAAMDADPRAWRPYVAADGRDHLLRLYGLSDRIRYYWPTPGVGAALERLFANVDAAQVPPGLVSQAFGALDLPGEGRLSRRAVEAKVGAVVAMYRRAAGAGRG